jgi:hypothetical protein
MLGHNLGHKPWTQTLAQMLGHNLGHRCLDITLDTDARIRTLDTDARIRTLDTDARIRTLGKRLGTQPWTQMLGSGAIKRFLIILLIS